MRQFIVHVNGKAYEVAVEEVGQGAVGQTAPVQLQTPAPAPVPTPAAAPAPVAEAPKKAAPAGGTPVKSPMPGQILGINVREGDVVKRGQVLLVLEAMKMENEIMAGQDGTVTSILTTKGASVNAGDVLMTLG